MENASKALLIIGVVFIALMILTIGVILRGRLQKTAEGYVTTLDNVEVQKYNSIFTVYADVNKLITAQDIVTMIGAAQKSDYETKIIIQGKGDCSNYDEQDKHKFLKDNVLKEDSSGNAQNAFSYVEDSLEYDNYGRVKKIEFKKN